MKRLLALILLLLPTAVFASGGGSKPPPWDPPRKIQVMFAYNANNQKDGTVCWSISSRYCKQVRFHAREMVDYMNYIFEDGRINAKLVWRAWWGMNTNINPHEVFNWDNQQRLRETAQSLGAEFTFLVNSRIVNDVRGTCIKGAYACWFAERSDMWQMSKQVAAHELGHWFGLRHYHWEWHDQSQRHGSGWGTWAWVDLMGQPGRHGRGLITKDIYADHQRRCDAMSMCGDAQLGSGGTWLRERLGSHKR